MPEAISNTSCIIILDKLGMLGVLKELYREITITDVVRQEFGRETESWIKIREVKDRKCLNLLQSMIDPGEASTIALALEINDPRLILDDDRARKLARSLHLKFTGTLGVILKARKRGLISSVMDTLNQLEAHNFRMSEELIKKVMKLSGETG